MSNTSPMPRTPQVAYRLGAMLFVPHYTLVGLYVCPNKSLAYAKQLIDAGAEPVMLTLWERTY
jgi:hypothetical protein